MHLTVKQLRYFMAVAEAGSISGALPSLNVSQSVVTESLRKLEEVVGGPLFSRHARGMTLTPAGQLFLRHAQEALSAFSRAEQTLQGQPSPVRGTLNLGVTSLLTAYYLPEKLARFERLFPDVRVRVVEDRRRFLQHLLIGGELDVAVVNVAGPPGAHALDTQALHTRTLIRSPWRVWLPAAHPLLRQGSVSLSDLAPERALILSGDELEDTTALVLRRAAFREIGVKTGSVEAIRSLVGLGLGVCVLPELAYRPWTLEGDRLATRPLEDDLPPLEVGLAWRRGSPLTAVAQAFLKMMNLSQQESGEDKD
ncbi:LysR family transcriptional regulator [Deinococcus sp. Arct2-2]|uniref:LysR family transcriptional regulator n=1 Tax=Deinococcus sp. Arct2-2 TaxID=2568653 RepID=UPI0010A2C6EE|nr:LysR family transcriptional regulator [Deinococcus sp. Arct2-2]THF68701.1 LysR family transcriptional regulator [Deinococcus sp. Arct2-2]